MVNNVYDNDYAPDEERSPWTRPGFIAAATVVGLVVIFAAVLALTGSHGGEAPRGPKPETPGAEAPAPAPADPDASAYGLKAGTQRIPVTPPKTKWVLSGTVAMSTSPIYGPAKTTKDGVHVGFQHSPTGALFAAAGFVADHTTLSSRKVAVRLTPGPSKNEAIAKNKRDNLPFRYQIAGFRFIDTQPDNVRLGIAIRATSGDNVGSLAALEYELVWRDGDWLINGERFTGYAIPNLTGYIPWGGA